MVRVLSLTYSHQLQYQLMIMTNFHYYLSNHTLHLNEKNLNLSILRSRGVSRISFRIGMRPLLMMMLLMMMLMMMLLMMMLLMMIIVRSLW